MPCAETCTESTLSMSCRGLSSVPLVRGTAHLAGAAACTGTAAADPVPARPDWWAPLPSLSKQAHLVVQQVVQGAPLKVGQHDQQVPCDRVYGGSHHSLKVGMPQLQLGSCGPQRLQSRAEGVMKHDACADTSLTARLGVTAAAGQLWTANAAVDGDKWRLCGAKRPYAGRDSSGWMTTCSLLGCDVKAYSCSKAAAGRSRLAVPAVRGRVRLAERAKMAGWDSAVATGRPWIRASAGERGREPGMSS